MVENWWWSPYANSEVLEGDQIKSRLVDGGISPLYETLKGDARAICHTWSRQVFLGPFVTPDLGRCF